MKIYEIDKINSIESIIVDVITTQLRHRPHMSSPLGCDLHPSLSFLHLGDAPGSVAQLQGLEAIHAVPQALHKEIQQFFILDLAPENGMEDTIGYCWDTIGDSSL